MPVIVYTTSTEQVRRHQTTLDGIRRVASAPPRHQPQRFGRCTGCGSVEVRLVRVDGTSAGYPFGYGCEACS